MKCQNCDAEATIFFKEVVDGQLREIHLCETCAAEKGFHLAVEQNKLTIANQFIWMAENLYPESASKVGTVQCPSCGIRYSQFARTGRLGCADCYGAFETQLKQILRRIHGATRHQGRAPRGGDGSTMRRRDLGRLREELNRAVEREEFELAARLRDEIRKLNEEPSAAAGLSGGVGDAGYAGNAGNMGNAGDSRSAGSAGSAGDAGGTP
jgi:protein arginine kinase activator